MNAYLAQPGTDQPTLVRRPVPTAGEGELLVRVQAVALNNGDLAPVNAPQVPGFEFCGEVTDVGADVDPAWRGRLVTGIAAGSFAEHVVAHHRHVLDVPAGVDPAAAATLPTALSTEYGAVRRSGMAAGDAVLVTAAGSGIALIGAQVARVLGAGLVIGTTRSAQRRPFLLGTGLDHVVVTDEQDLAEATRSVTAGAGADVVLDHIGGAVLDAAVAAARTGGSVVSVGRLAGGRADLDLFALARRRVVLQSVSYGLTPPAVIGDLMDGVRTELLPAVADGRLSPVVDSTHPFSRLGDALDRLRSGDAQGKVALVLS
ncbi:zinc-binding dehydrogenase [Modestobacter sp. Leaf380]|uniref:quinone oxidoreductase family protein n=1 Tax=Modestobacter sp. Leaf380 TaxID=1736356 RepID=UPI001F36B814|nr:zinc-binding dehydrogenase [Modestobacter sp. Leaf380]